MPCLTDENLRALAQEVLKRGSDFKFSPWCDERGLNGGPDFFIRGELTDRALRRLKKMKFEWPSTLLGDMYRCRMEKLADAAGSAQRSSGLRDGSSKTSFKRTAPATSTAEAAKRPYLNPGVGVAQRTGGEPVQSGVAHWRHPGVSSEGLHRPWERRDFHRPWES